MVLHGDLLFCPRGPTIITKRLEILSLVVHQIMSKRAIWFWVWSMILCLLKWYIFLSDEYSPYWSLCPLLPCCVVLCCAMYHGSSSSIIWREVPPSSLEGSESNVQRFLDTRNSRSGIYTDHVSHELKVDKSLKFEDDGWFRPMLVRLKAFSLVLFIYIVFIQATFYGHNKSPR